MSGIKKLSLVVIVNLVILFTSLGIIAIAPPIAYDLYRLLKPSFSHELASDSRSKLPNYQGHDWARKHFAEIRALPTEYFDFVVWRRKPFEGETIMIDADGHRRHFNTNGGDHRSAKIWFFGGSTAWGIGARDDETIPAYVQKYSGKSTFNFGETGYVAHQSLNLLMKAYLEGGRPETVFFYDGVNEVAHKCRTGQAVFSSAQELTVRERVQKTALGSSSFIAVFDPAIQIFRLALAKLGRAPLLPEGAERYDCHMNAEKATLIAEHLISNWKVAKSIVEANGGVFVPVLQPVAYIGAPNLNHSPKAFEDRPLSVADDQLLRKQYEIIYENIRLSAKQSQLDFVDITDVFDVQELVYIDFCHVSPNGNDLVAERLLKGLF